MYEEEIHFGKLLLKTIWHSFETFDPVLLCYPGRMCGQSLRKVGQGVLELLIENEKVTDGQTCAKLYALSSSKGA